MLEQARIEKIIGSSLEAKALIHIPHKQLGDAIKAFNPVKGNGIDELRYLLLTSQVELLDSAEGLQGLEYTAQTENWGVGVVKRRRAKMRSLLELLYSCGRISRTPLNLRTVCCSLSRRVLVNISEFNEPLSTLK